jgi:DNA-binding transcriptional regulator YiaG
MERKTEFAALCRELGLSVAEAARRIGVPYVTAYRWYAGTHRPSRMAREKVERLRRAARKAAGG